MKSVILTKLKLFKVIGALISGISKLQYQKDLS